MGNKQTNDQHNLNKNDILLEEMEKKIKKLEQNGGTEMMMETLFKNSEKSFILNTLKDFLNEKQTNVSLTEIFINFIKEVMLINSENVIFLKLLTFYKSKYGNTNGFIEKYMSNVIKWFYMNKSVDINSDSYIQLICKSIEAMLLCDRWECFLNDYFIIPFDDIVSVHMSNYFCSNSDLTNLANHLHQRIQPHSILFENDTLLQPSIYWLISHMLPQIYFKDYNEPVTKLCEEHPQPDTCSSSETTIFKPHWTLLYSAKKHGFSVNRFKAQVFNYNYPTISFMRLSDQTIYCIANDVEWKDEPNMWGGNFCSIFSFLPSINRITEGSNIIYCREKARSNLKTGFAFGRNIDNPMIYMDEDLTKVEIKINKDFETANLLEFETWGCAGDVGLKGLKNNQTFKQQEIEKRNKVKLNGENWQENPDKILLDMINVSKSRNE